MDLEELSAFLRDMNNFPPHPVRMRVSHATLRVIKQAIPTQSARLGRLPDYMGCDVIVPIPPQEIPADGMASVEWSDGTVTDVELYKP